MNAPTEPEFFDLKNGMGYLMHQPNKTTVYSRKDIFKLNERPHECFFKEGSADTEKSGIIQLSPCIL